MDRHTTMLIEGVVIDDYLVLDLGGHAPIVRFNLFSTDPRRKPVS